MTTKLATELLQDYLAAIQNPAAAAALFAEDGVLELPTANARAQGPAAIQKFLTGFLGMVPGFKFHNIRVLIETPDQAFGEYDVEVLVPATGKLYKQSYAGRLVAENGKIKLLREALDTLAASRAFSPDDAAPVPVSGQANAAAANSAADEQRKAVVVDYIKALDNGGTTPSGGSVIDLFADDAQVYFPKWGVAKGKAEILKLFMEFGPTLKAIRHDYNSFVWTLSGGSRVAVEGTSSGEHRDGPWVGGRWCDVFEINKDSKIERVFIYLDPDYAGKDTARYPWLATSV
jgi:ketosteroid isomerase-like protein